MTDRLPLPVVRYLAARTPDEIADCFAEDAVVSDERQTHRGRPAIRAWRQEADKISYRQDILSAAADGSRATVTCRLTGDFKGSPVTLDYRFALREGLIGQLEIS
jgi:hypothetical protein